MVNGERALKLVEAEDGFSKLTSDKPDLGQELGTEFGWNDRLFYSFRDGQIFDYSDWEARDLREFLNTDYKGRQIDAVKTLPIIGSQTSILPAKGDSGEAELIQSIFDGDAVNDGGPETPLSLVIAQMTSAHNYKKSFHEITWDYGTEDFTDTIIPKKIGWRPQTTCRLGRDPENGAITGFLQEQWHVGQPVSSNINNYEPKFIKAKNALIHLYGQRFDPINGTSDQEIPFWAYKTKEKILFLWFQFLEGVALPRTTVKARDPEISRSIARSLSKAKNSGVVPVDLGGGAPDSVSIDPLDLSGKGSDQFMAAISWLDQCATNSILAGFLDLTGAAANGLRGGGGGSYALSKDASDYYLQGLEADCRELEWDIRHQLFLPIVRWNLGPKAKVPKFKFDPLQSEDKSMAVSLLQAMLTVQGGSPPPIEFTASLASMVAEYLGLDGKKVEAEFIKADADAKAQALAQQKAIAKGQAVPGGSFGRSPAGQQIAGMNGALNAAVNKVKMARTGKG